MKRNGPSLDPELRFKQSILWVIGPVIIILALSFPVVFLLNREGFASYCAIIGPILSAGVVGLVHYVAGKSSK
jgi:hypothetical protein